MLADLFPIVALLAVISVVVWRLPKIELGHSDAYKRRRFANWFPLGLTYAFLYMGRYNLSAAKHAIGLSNADYGWIGNVGSVVYGVAFLLNGPLTDRWGGRTTILLAAAGAAVANIGMGVVLWMSKQGQIEAASLPGLFAILYALNMYFQSFGAVSIVKVNTAWFHLRERGTFAGIFGILIALGLYFAFDWSRLILGSFPQNPSWVFFIPAGILVVFFVLDFFFVRDTPELAGHASLNPGEIIPAKLSLKATLEVGKKMITHPVILTVALIEFCSGFLRNAIMQWYQPFAQATGLGNGFVSQNWGMLLCMAGIFGGTFAGFLSDHLFGSRRGPVSAVLYGGLLGGAIVGSFVLDSPAYGWVIIFMSLCVIGVHGMLSAAASMDFAGKHNVGLAVGLIDGMVYLGTGLQYLLLGYLTPKEDAMRIVSNWQNWPIAMIPLALVGLLLSIRIWHSTAQKEPSAPTENAHA